MIPVRKFNLQTRENTWETGRELEEALWSSKKSKFAFKTKRYLKQTKLQTQKFEFSSNLKARKCLKMPNK